MRTLPILAAVAATATLAAQSPAPARFDVASVKVNRSGQPMQLGPTLQQGGRVYAVNLPLSTLVRVAHGLQDNQLVGTPGWAESERFDIEARTAATTTPAEARAMLRQLLVERFAFAAHSETRELPIYELVVNTPGRLGPQLKAAGAECAPPRLPQGVPPPPPPPPSMAGQFIGESRFTLTCLSVMFPGGASVRSMSMDGLAESLTTLMRRSVVNRTALSGAFDYDLTYTPEFGDVPAGGAGVRGGGPGGPPQGPAPSTAPMLPTALREQLGLKLEGSRGPVQVLVIDRVERPTEN